MQLTMHVQLADGGDYQVKTNLFTIVALERKFKIRASDLEHGVAMEHLCFLAYEASKQHEIVVPAAFDDFIKKVTNIEILETDGANPSEPAQ
jgi:hypothetical protein